MYSDTAADTPPNESLAVGLGWLSLAIGVAELAAPQHVARAIGIAPNERTLTALRASGAREVAAGLAILSQPENPTWLWSRVAGDALDLATLAGTISSPGTDTRRAVLATAAVLGRTALDVLCARQLSAPHHGHDAYGRAADGRLQTARDRRVRVSESITINHPLERIEQRWSDLDSLPEALRLCGRSSDDSGDRAIVELRHAPGGRGTEVRVEIEYSPRGGVLGAALAKVIGADPTGQVRQDLRRLKQMVETGDVMVSDGPALRRPAQPARDARDIRRAAGLEVR